MPSRGIEGDAEFKRRLQNAPKPINNTETSPEMKQYLDDLNSGRLIEIEKQKRADEERKRIEEASKHVLFCNACRRPTLKKTPQGMYACGFCGAQTNSPLRMAPS
jgi:hypothetical protein